MRMWKIKPEYLCNRHLLREHLEMHMFLGRIRKGGSLAGYINKRLVEVDKIVDRHSHISIEMERRNLNHDSIMTEGDYVTCQLYAENCEAHLGSMGMVRSRESIKLLRSQCEDCRRKLSSYSNFIFSSDLFREERVTRIMKALSDKKSLDELPF